jgi:hypothetical protein
LFLACAVRADLTFEVFRDPTGYTPPGLLFF